MKRLPPKSTATGASAAAIGVGLALLLLASPTPAGAQEAATVMGIVTAADTVTPVPAAELQLVAEGRDASLRTTRSGPDGRYVFTEVPAGRYRLVVSHADYHTRTITVDVPAVGSVTVSPVLEPRRGAADTVAVVTGRVLEALTATAVPNAIVSVEGTQLRVRSGPDGSYRLVGVPPGPQVVRVQIIGYAPARTLVVVPAAGVLQRDIRLARNPLQIEGLTVTADRMGRARGELGTATVIDREAIRHITATSLSQVLELVPGTQQQPAGLDNVQQFVLRSVPTSGSSVRILELSGGTRAQDLAAFGTLIVVDGVPATNNANLQSLGPRGELGFPSAAGGGIDLRQIPASTLERVEVIRGVPSARWGDLTQGAVIVETRAGRVEPELKVQRDVRTTQASLVGGDRLGGGNTFTGTFDFAGTRSAPGQSDDFAYRVAMQAMHRLDLGAADLGDEPRLRFDTRLEFFQLFDDRPTNPNTGRTAATSSRDRGWKLTERARYYFGEGSSLSFTGGVVTVEQRSESSDSLTRVAMPFTDRLSEGRAEGHFIIGQYAARVDVDGSPWSVYGRLELERDGGWLARGHDARVGLELRREWNSGPGRQFDIEFPPQVTFNGVNGFDRPRRYDDLPAISTSALYWDSRIRRRVGSVAFDLQAGLRLDLLHRGSSWVSRVRDHVLQPRLNLELQPVRWLRLRGGWGRTAKTPSLRALAPDLQYYDVVNVNYFTSDPAERLAVLTTFIRDPTNPELGFARATKAEAGIELGFGESAISLVAFRDRIEDGAGIRPEPSFIVRDHYQLTDSVIGNAVKPDIIEPAFRADSVPILVQRPANIITQTNRGLELTAFVPEFRPIGTRLTVTGSWIETRQTTDALYFGSAETFSNFQLQELDRRTPYWGPAVEVGRRAFLTYRIIHHQPHAGLIVTAAVQHNVTDKFFDIAATDTLAYLGYLTYDGRLVPVPEAERGDAQFADLRLPRGGLLAEPQATPADWMMSVQVSKTLPLDGRLNFWAFNLLDRPGQVQVEPTVRRRPYRSVRVGLEVTLPLPAAAVWQW